MTLNFSMPVLSFKKKQELLKSLVFAIKFHYSWQLKNHFYVEHACMVDTNCVVYEVFFRLVL